MSQTNTVILVGNLTIPPILDYTKQEKKPFALFTLANHLRSKTGECERVNFVPCIAWGALAGPVASKIMVGDTILVEGRINTSSWERDGVQRTKTQIFVERFEILRKKGTAHA